MFTRIRVWRSKAANVVETTLNPGVTNSNVVVLAGAGASSALGKWTMSEFLEHLTANIRDDTPERHALDFIHEHIPESQDDLEALIDGVNQLEAYRVIVSAQQDGGFVDDPLAVASSALRRLVFTMIIRHYGAIPPDSSTALHSSMWGILSRYDASPNYIPVFTTNYDWGFETFAAEGGIRLLDGFKAAGLVSTWNRGPTPSVLGVGPFHPERWPSSSFMARQAGTKIRRGRSRSTT